MWYINYKYKNKIESDRIRSIISFQLYMRVVYHIIYNSHFHEYGFYSQNMAFILIIYNCHEIIGLHNFHSWYMDWITLVLRTRVIKSIYHSWKLCNPSLYYMIYIIFAASWYHISNIAVFCSPNVKSISYCIIILQYIDTAGFWRNLIDLLVLVQ